MFDHWTVAPETSNKLDVPDAAHRAQRTGADKSAFLGIDLIVRWDGTTRDLVRALQHTGLERFFRLSLLMRGSRCVWPIQDCDPALSDENRDAIGSWRVRFDTTLHSQRRAEAYVPRLLESVATRAQWHSVEKRFERPSTRRAFLGDWSAPPLPLALQENAA